MAHLHNFHKNRKPSFFADVGNKIKYGLELAGTAKGLYDVGKFIYSGMQAAAPMISAASMLL